MIFACVMISGCATSNNSEVEKATKEDEIGVNGATEVGKAEGGVDSNIINENLIEVDELSSYIGTEKLTLENWEDYFEVVEGEQKTTDSFGEEVDDGSKYIFLSVHAKDFVYDTGNDVVMIFSLSYTETEGDYNLETQEYTDFSQYEDNTETDVQIFNYAITEKTDCQITTILYQAEASEGNTVRRVERNIAEWKLEKITGTVATLNIPDELWNIDEDGKQYIAVKSGDSIDRLWNDHCDRADGTSKVYGGYNFYEVVNDYLGNKQ